jgi:hypothetical protein
METRDYTGSGKSLVALLDVAVTSFVFISMVVWVFNIAEVVIFSEKTKLEVAKYLLQQWCAKTRRLPLHEFLEDVTSYGTSKSSGVPPLCAALDANVLGRDDVVVILEYLVGQSTA